VKRFPNLLVLILISVAPLLAQSSSTPEQADDHVRELVLEGKRLSAEGNYNAALEDFRQSHSLAPEDVEAIIGLAHAEALHTDKSGNVDMQTQAAADYRAAIARQPTAELYAELGAILDAGKDYAAAITAYRKALDLNPEFLMAQVNYGSALVSIGDPDSAISFFSKVCAQSRSDHPGSSGSCGNARIVASRGWAYSNKGDCPSLSLAEKDYSEAVSVAPENAVFHSLLGDVLLNESGMGTRDLKCAHSKHEREAYLDRAWSQYRSALNLDSANTMYRLVFVTLSELLKRKPEYNGGIAKEPDKAELSQLFAQHPAYGKALAELETPNSAQPDSLESLKTLADSKLSVEHNKEVTAERDAVAAAKEAIRAEPTDGFAWGKLGDAYFQLGDYKNAKDATEKAVEIYTEKFKHRPNPLDREVELMLKGETKQNALARARDEDCEPIVMLAVYLNQLADICDKLHKKREASRYRDSALRAFDVMQTMQPISGAPAPQVRVGQQSGAGVTRPTQTAPLSPARPALRLAPPLPQCQLPVHELCQYPTFHPQPYDPNQPYRAPDTRDYDRCVLGNQREDARYQQCVQQAQRERQDH
jgi:tetratricopeptide (TPR) repeat protein